MKCAHYKGDGYTYKMFGGQVLDLCRNCDGILLGNMKKQEVLEHKAQVDINEMLQNQIDKLVK